MDVVVEKRMTTLKRSSRTIVGTAKRLHSSSRVVVEHCKATIVVVVVGVVVVRVEED